MHTLTFILSVLFAYIVGTFIYLQILQQSMYTKYLNQDLFDLSPNITEIDATTIDQFIDRKKNCTVYFYNSSLQECQDYKQTFQKMASDQKFFTKFGAINCLNKMDLCKKLNNTDIPKVVNLAKNIQIKRIYK